ncbi:MAG: TetR/AcrR family transcriptional regulator [bacterium]
MENLSKKVMREQKRFDEILNAAQEIFLKKGFYGATMNEIAERALVSKFTVYQYFAGKDAILDGILARGFSILTRAVEKKIGDIKDPKRRFMALIRTELEFFESRKDFFQVLLIEKLNFESEVKNGIVPSYREHIRFIEKEFRKSIRQGFIRRVDPEDAAYMVFATLRAFALRWLFLGGKGRLSDKSEAVYDLVMSGLASNA